MINFPSSQPRPSLSPRQFDGFVGGPVSSSVSSLGSTSANMRTVLSPSPMAADLTHLASPLECPPTPSRRARNLPAMDEATQLTVASSQRAPRTRKSSGAPGLYRHPHLQHRDLPETTPSIPNANTHLPDTKAKLNICLSPGCNPMVVWESLLPQRPRDTFVAMRTPRPGAPIPPPPAIPATQPKDDWVEICGSLIITDANLCHYKWALLFYPLHRQTERFTRLREQLGDLDLLGYNMEHHEGFKPSSESSSDAEEIAGVLGLSLGNVGDIWKNEHVTFGDVESCSKETGRRTLERRFTLKLPKWALMRGAERKFEILASVQAQASMPKNRTFLLAQPETLSISLLEMPPLTRCEPSDSPNKVSLSFT